MGFGEIIVNLTNVKQLLVSITENACLEGMILDKLSMNVNALLEFRVMFVKPTVDMTTVSDRALIFPSPLLSQLQGWPGRRDIHIECSKRF